MSYCLTSTGYHRQVRGTATLAQRGPLSLNNETGSGNNENWIGHGFIDKALESGGRSDSSMEAQNLRDSEGDRRTYRGTSGKVPKHLESKADEDEPSLGRVKRNVDQGDARTLNVMATIPISIPVSMGLCMINLVKIEII